MISLERCKEILKDESMTDEEVGQLRDALYGMVESIVDDYLKERAIINVCKKPSSIAG